MTAIGMAVPDSEQSHNSLHEWDHSNHVNHHDRVHESGCNCHDCQIVNEDGGNLGTYTSNQRNSIAIFDTDAEYPRNEEGSSDEESHHSQGAQLYQFDRPYHRRGENNDRDGTRYVRGPLSYEGLFDCEYFDLYRPTRLITQYDFVPETDTDNDNNSSSRHRNGLNMGSSNHNNPYIGGVEDPFNDVVLSLLQEERLRIASLEATLLESGR